MKLRKFGQVFLAIAVSLGSILVITACGNTHTVDFVYVTSSKNSPGQVSVYKVDSGSGALTQLPQSPYPSGGRNPVAQVVSPNFKNLYVVNRDDNTVVQFAIGTDGKLYPQSTVNTPGGFPVAVAINSAGTFLYVVDTYQPGFTDATPGPGAVVVYPIASTGKLGAPVPNGILPFFPAGLTPTSVNVLAGGKTVYVVSKGGVDDKNVPQLGRVYMFNTASGGALTPVDAGFIQAGTAPNAITSDPGGRWVYVTDGSVNQLIGYTASSSGSLTPMVNGPFKTDSLPISVAIDPRGFYMYVANYNAGTVSAYAIDQGTGVPSQVAGVGTYKSGPGASGVVVEPALGRYVYTANFIDNTVSALQLNTHSGALIGVQNSPFNAAGQPTSVAVIPHGNHSVQAVP